MPGSILSALHHWLFLFKRTCFPITKLYNHTASSSRVCTVTSMVESSLGISSVLKVIKEKKRKRKSIQNKSKVHDDFGERHRRQFLSSLILTQNSNSCITQTSFECSVREIYLAVHEGDQEHQILFCALIFLWRFFQMLAFSICFRGL